MACGPVTGTTVPAIRIGANTLNITLEPGEAAWLRRSSLIFADGPFRLNVDRIAQRQFSVIGTFSGQVRWANRFTADGASVELSAARDHEGSVVSLDVTPQAPVYVKPWSYLGHSGALTFNTERVARKEFWTMMRVAGCGTVHIKLHGTAQIRRSRATGSIVDTNYVAAIAGAFKAHGKVFRKSDVVRSGELENVRLSGDGHIVLQSRNPEESMRGGGGIMSLLGNLLPF